MEAQGRREHPAGDLMSAVHDTTIDALAVLRITRLIIDDEITADWRGRWFDEHDPSETKLGYLVTCPWCTGFWVSVAVVAVRRAAPKIWDPAAHVFALSAVAGVLYSRI